MCLLRCYISKSLLGFIYLIIFAVVFGIWLANILLLYYKTISYFFASVCILWSYIISIISHKDCNFLDSRHSSLKVNIFKLKKYCRLSYIYFKYIILLYHYKTTMITHFVSKIPNQKVIVSIFTCQTYLNAYAWWMISKTMIFDNCWMSKSLFIISTKCEPKMKDIIAILVPKIHKRQTCTV